MSTEAERKRDPMVGAHVRVQHDPESDRQYIEESRERRRAGHGQTGLVLDLSNAHGLCYHVSFDHGGSRAWYEPNELVPLEVPKPKPVAPNKLVKVIDGCSDRWIHSPLRRVQVLQMRCKT